MNAKIVNDNQRSADRIERKLRKIDGILEVEQIWAMSIQKIASQIEAEDLVVLDVNLGPLGPTGGFKVFKALVNRYPEPFAVIFDSIEKQRSKLITELSDQQNQILNQLEAESKVVFALEKFDGDLDQSVKKIIRRFSFVEACQKLFNPFLPLHVAVQHLQSDDRPNPDLFKPVNQFDFPLEKDRQEAKKYAETLELDLVEGFLDGSLKTLCKILASELNPQTRLAKIQPLAKREVGADFLAEFRRAVDALQAMS